MKIKNVLGCVGWAGFLLVSSLFIPVAGPLLLLLTPLPFLYYSVKEGPRYGIQTAILSTLIIVLAFRIAGYTQLIIFAFQFSLLGICLSELFRKRLGVGQTILWATLFMLILSVGFVFFLASSKDMGIQRMVFEYMRDQLNLTIRAYEEMGITKEATGELEIYGNSLLKILSKIYPSLMIIGTGFLVWLNVLLGRSILRTRNLQYPDFGSLDRWRTPDILIWLVIVSGFALFLSTGDIRSLAINILIVMMVIYFFHGLAIMVFFLNKYRVPLWLRIIFYFLLFFQQVFTVCLALVGLFDQWVDFRRIQHKDVVA